MYQNLFVFGIMSDWFPFLRGREGNTFFVQKICFFEIEALNTSLFAESEKCILVFCRINAPGEQVGVFI